MAAANTDKYKKLSKRWVGQIGSGGVADAVTTTIPLASVTNLATDTAVLATIDRVDANGVATPSLEETVIGVVSGSNLANCVRASEGTAQAHNAGAVVEILVTAKGYNDIIDGILVGHNQDGTHKSNSDTQTLSNKRITKRVLSLSAGSATPTINTDLYDVVHITAQSAAITSFTTNLSGTPVEGDTLRIDITDNGTARAITWGASFESSAVTLPTTTILSQRVDVNFVWNTVTSKWRCISVTSVASGGASVTDEDNSGGSSTSSSTFANITGADVALTPLVTSNIWLTAFVTCYGNVAGAPYSITWHDGTSVIGPSMVVYLAASNLRTTVAVQTIVTNKAAGGPYTYTVQHKSNDNSSSLTAEAVNLTASASPA